MMQNPTTYFRGPVVKLVASRARRRLDFSQATASTDHTTRKLQQGTFVYKSGVPNPASSGVVDPSLQGTQVITNEDNLPSALVPASPVKTSHPAVTTDPFRFVSGDQQAAHHVEPSSVESPQVSQKRLRRLSRSFDLLSLADVKDEAALKRAKCEEILCDGATDKAKCADLLCGESFDVDNM